MLISSWINHLLWIVFHFDRTYPNLSFVFLIQCQGEFSECHWKPHPHLCFLFHFFVFKKKKISRRNLFKPSHSLRRGELEMNTLQTVKYFYWGSRLRFLIFKINFENRFISTKGMSPHSLQNWIKVLIVLFEISLSNN